MTVKSLGFTTRKGTPMIECFMVTLNYYSNSAECELVIWRNVLGNGIISYAKLGHYGGVRCVKYNTICFFFFFYR